MSNTPAQENVSNVDALVAKFNGSTGTTTPETFVDKQKKQRAEAQRSHRRARDNMTGIRLSLGSAMAAVKPKSIAKMATVTVSWASRRQQPSQLNSLVSAPSQLPVESSNPAFEESQEDDVMEGNKNPLWELAEAIHCDDASNLFTYIERCSTVKKFQRPAETDSRDFSNKAAPQVQEIYESIYVWFYDHIIDATNLYDATLTVAARSNRVALVRTMLAVDAANGVEWSIAQERALDAACTNGHLEVATVIACVDDGQVSSMLDQSLALRYYCLAGDLEHAREVLTGDSPDVTIKEALLDACRNGRCDIVALLTADARFDQAVDGEKAFELACVNGHVEVVSVLWRDFGLSLFGLSNVIFGLKRALQLAANAGHCDVVALLVQDERANPGLDKSFALEHYCLAGDVKRVKAALDGPDFVAAPVPGANLTAASRNGHVAIVELLLLDPRVDPASDYDVAIRYASFGGHENVVKLLLADPRVDPAAQNNSAIRNASSIGCVSVVKLLLADPRVDPAAQNNVAIHYASSGGHESVVKLLLADSRVDPADDNNVAIRLASERGHESVVKLLLADPRVDPSAVGNYAIEKASCGGHKRVVDLLLADQRVDPVVGENLAIRLASLNGFESVGKLLLADLRVDPGAKNNAAIYYAACEGHSSVVEVLLADQRVDPRAQDNRAIRGACHYGYASVVELLLADQRVDPSMGHPTALERASDKGHVDIVQMLLEHHKVVVTKAALVAADERHHGDIIRLLIEQQPRVLHDLFEDATPCIRDGELENGLRQRQKASALTFLLAVERCGGYLRVSDVLREVMVEYACFDLIDNYVDDSSSIDD
jgi:ankyrin repeat protein